MPTPRYTPPPAYDPAATGSANIMAPLESIMNVLSQADARRQAERKLDYMGEDTATRAMNAQTRREEMLLRQDARRMQREYKQAELRLKEQDLQITRAAQEGRAEYNAGLLTLGNARLSAQIKREDAQTELERAKQALNERVAEMDAAGQEKRLAYLEAVLIDRQEGRASQEKLARDLAAEKDEAKKAQLQMQIDARKEERAAADEAEMERLMAKEEGLNAREAARLDFLRDKQGDALSMFDEAEARKEAESLRNYGLAKQKFEQSQTEFQSLEKQFEQSLAQKETASARTDATRNRAIDVNVLMLEKKLAADAANLERTLAEKELERLRRENADAGVIRMKQAELNAKKDQFNRAQTQKERIENMAAERAQLKLEADNAKTAAQTALIKTKDQLQQLAYQQKLAAEQRQQSAQEIAGVKLSGMLASISKTSDDPIENTIATYEVLRQFGFVGYGDTSIGDKAVVEANRGLLTPEMTQALQGVMEAQSRQMIEYGDGKTVSRMEAFSKMRTDDELRNHFNKTASADQKAYIVDMISGSDPNNPRAVIDFDGNINLDPNVGIPATLGLRAYVQKQAGNGAPGEVTLAQVRQTQMVANDVRGFQQRLQQDYGITAGLASGGAPALMAAGQVLISPAFRQVKRDNGKLTDEGIKAQTHNAALFAAATTALTGGLSPDQLDLAWAGLDESHSTSQYLDAIKTRQQGLATAYEYAKVVPGLAQVLPTLSNEKLDMMNNITQQIGSVRPGEEVNPVDGMAMGDILGALAGKSASKNSTLKEVISLKGVTPETVLQVARSEARAAYIERTYNGGPEGTFPKALFKKLQQGGEAAYNYFLNNQDAFVTLEADGKRKIDTARMDGMLGSFIAKQSSAQLATGAWDVLPPNGDGAGQYLTTVIQPTGESEREDTTENKGPVAVGGEANARAQAYGGAYGDGPTVLNRTKVTYKQQQVNVVTPAQRTRLLQDAYTTGTWASKELAKFMPVLDKSIVVGGESVHFDSSAVEMMLSDSRVSPNYRAVMEQVVYDAANRKVQAAAGVWNKEQADGYATVDQAKKSGMNFTDKNTKIISVMEPNGQPRKATVTLGKDDSGGEFITATLNDTGQQVDWKKAVEGFGQAAQTPEGKRAQVITLAKASRLSLTPPELDRVVASGSVDEIKARSEHLETLYKYVKGWWGASESEQAAYRLLAKEVISGGAEQGVTEAQTFVDGNTLLGAGTKGFLLPYRGVFRGEILQKKIGKQFAYANSDPTAVYGLTKFVLDAKSFPRTEQPWYNLSSMVRGEDAVEAQRVFRSALNEEGLHVADNGWVCPLTAKDSAFNVSMSQMPSDKLWDLFIEEPDGVWVLRPEISPKAEK